MNYRNFSNAYNLHGALAHNEEEAQLVATAASWLRDLILVGIDTRLRRTNLVGLQGSWLHDQGTSRWSRASW